MFVYFEGIILLIATLIFWKHIPHEIKKLKNIWLNWDFTRWYFLVFIICFIRTISFDDRIQITRTRQASCYGTYKNNWIIEWWERIISLLLNFCKKFWFNSSPWYSPYADLLFFFLSREEKSIRISSLFSELKSFLLNVKIRKQDMIAH